MTQSCGLATPVLGLRQFPLIFDVRRLAMKFLVSMMSVVLWSGLSLAHELPVLPCPVPPAEILGGIEISESEFQRNCSSTIHDHNLWHKQGSPTFIMHENTCTFRGQTGPYPDGCIPTTINFTIYRVIGNDKTTGRNGWMFGRRLAELPAREHYYPDHQQTSAQVGNQ